VTNPNFADLGVIEPILKSLHTEGYSTPTPIQTKTIPLLLAGRDLVGLAQTGTGKTAAFAIPLLQQLAAGKRDAASRPPIGALVLAPTRELAVQIGRSFGVYGRHLGLKHTVIYGGVGQGPQVQAIRRGLDVLVATPGRLLDLMEQRHIRLDRTTFLVLDEADRMFDMGFIRDVRKIVAAMPSERQTLMFSATMSAEIAELARNILKSPARVEVTPEMVPAERISQHVYHVERADKRRLLHKLLSGSDVTRAIVFTRTKHGANRVVEQLARASIVAEALHGNKSQNARQRALQSFRSGDVRVLVATDIAARGLDIPAVSHVFNYELPMEPESYVHRIGRTARAGAMGAAVSFCDPSERATLRDIERLTKNRLIVTDAELPRQTREAIEAERNADRSAQAASPRGGDGERRSGGHAKSGRAHHGQSRPRQGDGNAPARPKHRRNRNRPNRQSAA